MHRTTRKAALLLALVTIVSQPAPAQDLVTDTRSYLSKLEKLGFAGVVVIKRGGETVLAQGSGLADRESGRPWSPATVSDIGSITKQFTAAAILALEEAGKLHVTDTITAYFPEVPPDKQGITIHHLLTHTSGVLDLDGAGDWDPIGRDEFVRKALAQPLGFAPGKGYDYSNAGYSLLGAIIEQVTGQSWETYVRARLLLPQGMTETGYVLPNWGPGRLAQGYRGGTRWGTTLERPMDRDGPYWVLRANGGVHSTSLDMVRWAEALQAGRVLSAASVEKLWAPHADEGGGTHYAYGWVIADVGGTRVITHNGGNGIHFANLAIVPSSGTVVFLQTNVIADQPVGSRLLEQIGRRMLGGVPYPEVPDLTEVAPAALDEVTGAYQLAGQGSIRITRAGSELRAEAQDPHAFMVLHSTRSLDSARAARLSARTDAFVKALIGGDFEPMRQARGGDRPPQALAAAHGDWARSAGLGQVTGHRVIGTALQEGRDLTVVRYQFERGTADRAYVWDTSADGRLLGVSGRGLPTSVRLVPTGPGRFGSWDGGVTPSMAFQFAPTQAGRMQLTFRAADGEAIAVR
ncbi:MAG TPA: serine hydrolase domain-containing protein [Gemmatimonadales bacterium]